MTSAGSKTLALIDFDGTITSQDSLLSFILFSRGKFKTILGMVLLLPQLLCWRLHLLSHERAKQMVLVYFFGNMPVVDFNDLCDCFVRERVPQIIRPSAIWQIEHYKSEGARVIVVSASPENWVGRWAQSHGIEAIATHLEVKNELITGKILKNCSGDEKVRRIRAYVDLSKYAEIHTYGDQPSDWPMLRLGTLVHFRPF